MKPMLRPVLIDVPESFVSERLELRAPRFGDGKELCAAVNETLAELKPWMPWAQKEMNEEEAEENIRRARSAYLLREDLRLHLYLKGTDTLIGCGGMHRIDWEVPRFEIGYWCRKQYQRQGYITEAAAAIAEFALEKLGALRLEIRLSPENERSSRIPPKIGFALEARLRDQMRTPDGVLRDTLLFTRFPVSQKAEEAAPQEHHINEVLEADADKKTLQRGQQVEWQARREKEE